MSKDTTNKKQDASQHFRHSTRTHTQPLYSYTTPQLVTPLFYQPIPASTMVRPRLVEEGKPLGDWIDSDNDESEEESMDTDHHPATTSSSTPTSSLLRALGGSLPRRSHSSSDNQQPQRAMRFEIGGDYCMQDDEPSARRQSTKESSSSFWHKTHLHVSPPTLPPNPPTCHPSTQRQSTTTQTHFEVGADYRPTERMQGVEDHSIPLPLVVLDGANVAYAYAHASQEHFHATTGKVEPDVRGLQVACAYFHACRVRIVLPASYVRNAPTDRYDILTQLQTEGKLVPSPPKDDDDAYCLTIAQRENRRALQARQGLGPAFVLSNDMFRDAQDRDASGQLKEWLEQGDRPETGPGRISYTFVDLGRKDDYGDPMFDIVPNPRHPLIAWVENQRKQQGSV